MKKQITVAELADELKFRLNKNKSVDCCKQELINLANIASTKIGDEMVEVNWKD
ncbi:MAG: hypothetical protein JXA77_16205 [Bacteroidales bacterium]|nr:hypothetical protein [Bacteroidales bacterium]MBN2818724.1 hypothetical protein [Bacteroidales bacterium]